jgi:choline monooxygenase
MVFDAESSPDHFIDAHWALYCDNYLEGFHIPFVHPTLNKALAFEQYQYETFPLCNLQTGIAKASQPAFKLPASSPDAGKSVFAYYFWLFPNLMLNFYPWGLSMNVVLPLAHDKTCVRYRTYRLPNQEVERSASGIEQTELEDQKVVLSVQKGLESRYYTDGRFSPEMEPCVHHFHLLVDAFMSGKTDQISR